MKFLDYLKEPVIRKHMFGIVQIVIGTIIWVYFSLKADTFLENSLFVFMGLSFLLGYRNINEAEKIFTAHRLLAYMRKKSKPKESREPEEQEYINDYEKTDVFHNTFSDDLKEQ